MSARSTSWNITNATPFDWNLTSSKLSGGVWGSNPPQIIKSGKFGSFRAESDGFMTGDEGKVEYTFSEGTFTFYFNNPYLGACNYRVESPDSYDHATQQDTGNDQSLRSRCFKNT